MGALLRPCCAHWEAALSDLSLDSPLDGVHGNHEPVLARLAERSDTSIPAMSRAFSRVIAPLGSARATRVKAWRNWRTCLTWALARDALGQILPMPTSTLRAMLWLSSPWEPPMRP